MNWSIFLRTMQQKIITELLFIGILVFARVAFLHVFGKV